MTSTTSLPVGVSSSLRGLREVYQGGREPTLAALVGRHQATVCGPLWMRGPAPLAAALTGMPGWWGKQFDAPSDGQQVLTGRNLVHRHGVLSDSLPMTARLGLSRVDGRPALLLTYPPTAPRPWRHVVDELRPIADDVLLGWSFDIIVGVPTGVPFLLKRTTTTDPAGG